MYAKLNPLQIGLPQNAQKKDGTWVSNYNALPESALLADGWMLADEVKPVLAEGQTLELDTAVQLKDRIVLTYKAVDVPPDEIDTLLDRLESLI